MLKDLVNIARPLGLLLIAFTAAFVPPMLLSAIDGEGALQPFLVGLLANLALGLSLWLSGRGSERELKARDGFVLIAALWLLSAATAAIPLQLGLGLSYSRAWFEAVSGITTTGATVLVGLDRIPHALNLWRCELSWLGGLGILGLATAALPLLGVGGMQVYRAEASGPIKDSKLTPRFMQTARSLWTIYVALTAACAVALKLAGMSAFDALCHAFSALSLGAFSTRDTSIAAWNSPIIEAILAAFMLLAATNFATHFMVWRGRSLRPYLRDAQVFWMLVVLAGSIPLIALALRHAGLAPDLIGALRRGAFDLVSVGLGAGLLADDYGQWPLAAALWLLLLSCTLAGAGSVGGGVKVIRAIVLFRQAARDLYSLVHPNAVSTLKIGRQVVSDRTALAVVGFVHLYTALIMAFTFLLIASGMDLTSAFTTVTAMVNNSGTALHAGVAPTVYTALGDGQLWLCSLAMLVGRLELFVLVVLLTPAFWRE